MNQVNGVLPVAKEMFGFSPVSSTRASKTFGLLIDMGGASSVTPKVSLLQSSLYAKVTDC